MTETAENFIPSPESPALVFTGDMRLLTPLVPDEAYDTCITDPPYEIGFMGATWDKTGVAFDVATWKAVYDTLKPGGYLLAFGAARTYHRMACAIEDAGFEIRDFIDWVYGSGMPKSFDISKGLDRAAGAEREVIGQYQPPNGKEWNLTKATDERGVATFHSSRNNLDVTAPATEDAERWNGYGTNLKPAHEPIVVARKPFPGTILENVLKHGTGAINIDALRVPTDETLSFGSREIGDGVKYGTMNPDRQTEGKQHAKGRYPSNVLLDPSAAAAMDEQSGISKSSSSSNRNGKDTAGVTGIALNRKVETLRGHDDTGGASRFFPVFEYEAEDFYWPFLYIPKATSSERHEGTDDGNEHPTVKPVALMRFLCVGFTPPGGKIFDPFAGSGSTGAGARREGFLFVGMEIRPEAADTARARLAASEQTIQGELLRRRGGKKKQPKPEDRRQPSLELLRIIEAIPATAGPDLRGKQKCRKHRRQ